MKKKLIIYFVAIGAGILVGKYLASNFNLSASPKTKTQVSKNQEEMPGHQDLSQVVKISMEELKQKQDKGEKFYLLDNRSYEEYREKHIQGAISIPLEEFEKKISELALEENAEIITYCHGWHCSTSKIAALKLKEKGFSNVKVLDGSTKEWEAKGWSIESS